MNFEEYEKMYSQENTYWWFQGRKKILFKMMERFELLRNGKAKVLDVGCGTGLILEKISNRSFAVGIDFSSQALSFCKQRGLKNLIKGNVQDLPIRDSSVDLVLALDLLEHIEDDKGLIKEIQRTLKPDGYLLATVPAHQFLWSDHDEALHHYRRYSKRGFHNLISSDALVPIKYTYVITVTFIPIFLFRVIQKIYHFFVCRERKPKTHIIILPKILNSLLISILDIEGTILEYTNFPIGVSLLCIAQKKPDKPIS